LVHVWFLVTNHNSIAVRTKKFTGEVPFVQKSSSGYEVSDFRFLLLINNKTTATEKNLLKHIIMSAYPPLVQ
jgi:hypothetical protein